MFTLQQEADLKHGTANDPKRYNEIVALEVPIGELAKRENFALAIWADGLRRDGKLRTAPITGKERWDAQGLEGKAVLEMSYGNALLLAKGLPKFRFRIVKLETAGE